MRYIICGVAGVFFLTGCSKSDVAQHNFIEEKLDCPSPAVDQFEPWGQSGSAHICKIKLGPFVVYENGHVHLRGQYENGKEAGIWRWYSVTGEVEKQIDYGSTTSVAK